MAELRRVAIVGSSRIPFCRAYTGYTKESNLSMLTTAIGGLVQKFNLKGKAVDEVIGGADCKRKNASCTTSSARERQPVMRAAILTRISRLSTKA